METVEYDRAELASNVSTVIEQGFLRGGLQTLLILYEALKILIKGQTRSMPPRI